MDDFAWTGKKGHYWIHFEETQDGKVCAQASDPIKPSGRAQSVGPIARRTADTEEEAERLLIQELERLDSA